MRKIKIVGRGAESENDVGVVACARRGKEEHALQAALRRSERYRDLVVGPTTKSPPLGIGTDYGRGRK